MDMDQSKLEALRDIRNYIDEIKRILDRNDNRLEKMSSMMIHTSHDTGTNFGIASSKVNTELVNCMNHSGELVEDFSSNVVNIMSDKEFDLVEESAIDNLDGGTAIVSQSEDTPDCLEVVAEPHISNLSVNVFSQQHIQSGEGINIESPVEDVLLAVEDVGLHCVGAVPAYHRGRLLNSTTAVSLKVGHSSSLWEPGPLSTHWQSDQLEDKQLLVACYCLSTVAPVINPTRVKTVFSFDECVSSAKLDKSFVNNSVYVDGSTWIPTIHQCLQDFFSDMGTIRFYLYIVTFSEHRKKFIMCFDPGIRYKPLRIERSLLRFNPDSHFLHGSTMFFGCIIDHIVNRMAHSVVQGLLYMDVKGARLVVDFACYCIYLTYLGIIHGIRSQLCGRIVATCNVISLVTLWTAAARNGELPTIGGWFKYVVLLRVNEVYVWHSCTPRCLSFWTDLLGLVVDDLVPLWGCSKGVNGTILCQNWASKGKSISDSVVCHMELPVRDRVVADNVDIVQSMGVDMMIFKVYLDWLKDMHEPIPTLKLNTFDTSPMFATNEDLTAWLYLVVEVYYCCVVREVFSHASVAGSSCKFSKVYTAQSGWFCIRELPSESEGKYIGYKFLMDKKVNKKVMYECFSMIFKLETETEGGWDTDLYVLILKQHQHEWSSHNREGLKVLAVSKVTDIWVPEVIQMLGRNGHMIIYLKMCSPWIQLCLSLGLAGTECPNGVAIVYAVVVLVHALEVFNTLRAVDKVGVMLDEPTDGILDSIATHFKGVGHFRFQWEPGPRASPWQNDTKEQQLIYSSLQEGTYMKVSRALYERVQSCNTETHIKYVLILLLYVLEQNEVMQSSEESKTVSEAFSVVQTIRLNTPFNYARCFALAVNPRFWTVFSGVVSDVIPKFHSFQFSEVLQVLLDFIYVMRSEYTKVSSSIVRPCYVWDVATKCGGQYYSDTHGQQSSASNSSLRRCCKSFVLTMSTTNRALSSRICSNIVLGIHSHTRNHGGQVHQAKFLDECTWWHIGHSSTLSATRPPAISILVKLEWRATQYHGTFEQCFAHFIVEHASSALQCVFCYDPVRELSVAEIAQVGYVLLHMCYMFC